jgi:hypothetical protein
MMFFWVKSPCGLVGRSQCFREVCCLHFQGFTLEDGAEVLNMETAQSSKKAATHQSIWRFKLKEHHLNAFYVRVVGEIYSTGF